MNSIIGCRLGILAVVLLFPVFLTGCVDPECRSWCRNRCCYYGTMCEPGCLIECFRKRCVPCEDLDEDGYGTNNPQSLFCEHWGLDCDDSNAEVNPRATEGPDGDPTCYDTLDNDCDEAVDLGDSGCCECIDNDGDGYGTVTCENCTYPELDCDDSNPDVNPAAVEGPEGDPTCTDEMDNDCDGRVDASDVVGCRPPMAQIPAGCFDMGDAFNEGTDDELPVHNVCISAFEMDVHEVTNAEYAVCVDDGGCTAPAYSGSYSRPSYYGNPIYDDFPVIWVDWYQADEYCTWAGKRLPTEAEWEYAARGGLAGKRYPWGDTINGLDANYADSGDPWDNNTSPVGYYAPNGYGLYDMAGNVSEWGEDDMHESYDCDANPETYNCGDGGVAPTDGSAWVDDPRDTHRVSRGGTWYLPTISQRVASRQGGQLDVQISSLGFRCARGGAFDPEF